MIDILTVFDVRPVFEQVHEVVIGRSGQGDTEHLSLYLAVACTLLIAGVYRSSRRIFKRFFVEKFDVSLH